MTWQCVSSMRPCPICNKPDWCRVSADGRLAACRRVEGGATKTDKSGAPYYLHRLTGDRPPPPPPTGTAGRNGQPAPRADADTLHRVYGALLAVLSLTAAHRDALRRRGLSDCEIDRRGYGSLPIRGRAAITRQLGERFGAALAGVPGIVERSGRHGSYLTLAGPAGLLVPIRDVAGRIVALLARRDGDGAGPRYTYLSSTRHGGPGPGAPAHVPAGVIAPCHTVRITEGALKSDIAHSLSGLPTIGAAGLAWRPCLPILEALGCRTVRLAFDADARRNATVARALLACSDGLTGAGLAVELERWDSVAGKGIDDVLATGAVPEVLAGDDALAAVREIAAAAGVKPDDAAVVLDRLPATLADGGPAGLFGNGELLRALARIGVDDPARFAGIRAGLPRSVSRRDLDAALAPEIRALRRDRGPVLLAEAGYRVEGGRLCREHGDREGGTALRPLCNFTARITEVLTRDDGVERSPRFTVSGALANGRPLPPVPIDAADFAGLSWVTAAWHGRAVVYAGQGTRDHLRAAIELLSGDRAERTVYLHTGWREIAGAWNYLHAGGAIGPVGPAPGVEVQLPDPLAGYQMPPPPAGAALADAVRASLRLLELAPDRLMVPLLGATYRAALGDAPGALDLALWLAGPHGAGKSELAALAQQHYGPTMDRLHLPGNWASTSNALEGLAFATKDSLMVVDDYAPRGAIGDRQRLEREADRLLRAQGNRAGRQRMRADGSLRPERPPRGLILATGEDIAPGQSLRGRMLIVEVAPGDVQLPALTPHQRAGADGLYAQALAGFLRWLAPQYAELRRRLPGERAALRDRARAELPAGSPRTPGIVADLAMGWHALLDFALATGGVDRAKRDALAARGWRALVEVGQGHAEHIEGVDSAAQFIRLLAGAIGTVAYIAGPEGGPPEGSPARWGWHDQTRGTGDYARTDWQPCQGGRRIGWVEGDDLYLEPEAAYAAIQAMATQQGDGLAVSARMLWRRLRERGLLRSTDAPRQKLPVRRTLEGARRSVLHLGADSLTYPPETGPPGPPGPPAHKSGENGPVPWAGNGTAGAQPAHKPAQNSRENGRTGPVGPVGPVSDRRAAPAAPDCAPDDDTSA